MPNPDQTKNNASTKKPPIKWPDWVRDVTSEKLGEPLTIIGARQPARKPE